MNRQSARVIRCLVLGVSAAAAGLAAGCGGGDGDPAPRAVQRPVDPNQATAEALMQHVSGLLAAEPPELETFFELFMWENKKQQMYSDMVKTLNLPRARFMKATHGRVEDDPVNKSLRLEPIVIEDVAVNVSEDRATGTFQLGDETRTLHLMKFDGQWWIAGQTVEETPAMICPPHALGDRTDFILGELREAIFRLEPLGMAYTDIAREAAARTDDELPDFVEEKIRVGVLDYATRSGLTPRDVP